MATKKHTRESIDAALRRPIAIARTRTHSSGLIANPTQLERDYGAHVSRARELRTQGDHAHAAQHEARAREHQNALNQFARQSYAPGSAGHTSATYSLEHAVARHGDFGDGVNYGPSGQASSTPITRANARQGRANAAGQHVARAEEDLRRARHEAQTAHTPAGRMQAAADIPRREAALRTAQERAVRATPSPVVPAAPTPGRPSSQTQAGVHTTPPQRQDADYRTALARAEAATAEAHRARTPEAYRNAAEAHEHARSSALNNRAITPQDRELYAASHEGAVTGHARHAREAEAASDRRRPTQGDSYAAAIRHPALRRGQEGGASTPMSTIVSDLRAAQTAETLRRMPEPGQAHTSPRATTSRTAEDHTSSGRLASAAEHASSMAKDEHSHRLASRAHDHAASSALSDHAAEHHKRKAAEHNQHADRAKRGGLPLPHAHGGAKPADAPHALQKGKKGGSFYISNSGRKVYTKKS